MAFINTDQYRPLWQKEVRNNRKECGMKSMEMEMEKNGVTVHCEIALSENMAYDSMFLYFLRPALIKVFLLFMDS